MLAMSQSPFADFAMRRASDPSSNIAKLQRNVFADFLKEVSLSRINFSIESLGWRTYIFVREIRF